MKRKQVSFARVTHSSIFANLTRNYFTYKETAVHLRELAWKLEVCEFCSDTRFQLHNKRFFAQFSWLYITTKAQLNTEFETCFLHFRKTDKKLLQTQVNNSALTSNFIF